MASQSTQALPMETERVEERMDGTEQLQRGADEQAAEGDVQARPAKWRRVTGKRDPGAGWVAILRPEQLAERDALLRRLALREMGPGAEARSAYSLFCVQAWKEARASGKENPSRQIAKDWQALPISERRRWDEEMVTDRQRSKEQLEAFKTTEAFQALQHAADRFLRGNAARKALGEPEVSLKDWLKRYAAERAERSKAAKGEEQGEERKKRQEQRERDALVARLMRSLGTGSGGGGEAGAAPPRPAQTPYVIFLAGVKEEEAAKGGGIAEVMKRIASRWNGLDANAKAPYLEKAAKDRERYAAELAEFRASDTYKELSENAAAFQGENASRSAAGEAPRKLPEWLAAWRKEMRAKAAAARKRGQLLAGLLRRAPRSSGLKAAPRPPPGAYALFAAAKKGVASESCSGLPEVMKKLGSMWQEAPADEKAGFAKEAEAQRMTYEAALKAFQGTGEYSSFVAAFEEWQREGAGAGAFWAWHGKRAKLRRAQERVAVRAKARADLVAAKAAAKAQARALKAAAAAASKAAGKAKPGSAPAADAPMLPAVLEVDPFWDSIEEGAALDPDDLLRNDKLALACACKGGPVAAKLLSEAAARSTCATSLFRPRSADCEETSLHYALLREDLDMLRVLARETERSGGFAPAVVPKAAGLAGAQEPAVAAGTKLWYCPRGGGGAPKARSGPAADAAEVPWALSSGQAITVEASQGEWVKSAGGAWLPLQWNGTAHFVPEDPEWRRQRQCCESPELKPVSTGFSSGRAFRAKKLRKVKLSRGGREGNQAFVRDIGTGYERPSVQLDQTLRWAAARGVSLATLTACSALFHKCGYVDPATLLGTALRFGRTQLARELVDKFGVNDFWGLNALHKLALKEGPSEEEIADAGKRKQSILKKAQENFEVSPLHCASVGPEPKILEALLEPIGAGAEDQTRDEEQRTLLHYAAAAEAPAALETLLGRGFSPHRTDKNGFTPLMVACMANRPLSVRKLLSVGADPLARAEDRTAFHWAAWYGAREALEELLGHQAAGKVKGPTPFEKAANSSKQTAMHLACARGEEALVKELLTRVPRCLNKVDKQGRSPLVYAVMNGHTKLASFLLSRGAIVDQADTSGNTPLHYALAYGWRDAARLLVDWGHTPDAQNAWRNTPVDAAILKAHYSVVAWFAENHAINPDVKDEKGRTLLSRACAALEHRQWRSILRAVVQRRGADVNLADGSGNLPICIAVQKCAQTSVLHDEVAEALKSLCAAKADVSRKQDKSGGAAAKDQSALSIALRGRNHGLLCLMLQSGAGVAVHGHGETLLHTISDRLLNAGREDVGEGTSILDAIKRAVPQEVLKEMARTPDQQGLLPMHAAALRFNVILAQVKRRWAEYRKREEELLARQKEQQQRGQNSFGFGAATVQKQPPIEVKTEDQLLQAFRDLVTWLAREADASLDASVARLSAQLEKLPEGGACAAGAPGRVPSSEDAVVEASVPAHDKELWKWYNGAHGLCTPLMMLVAGGCSEAVEWFVAELQSAGALERCLAAANLYGSTPLAVALDDLAAGKDGLRPEVVIRLVSLGAVAVRAFDGRMPLHRALLSGASGGRPSGAAPSASAATVPTSAGQSASARTKAQMARDRIVEIWKKNRPSQVAQADDILARFKGREESAYLMVCKKYGVTPEKFPAVTTGAEQPGPAVEGSAPTGISSGDQNNAMVFEAVLEAAVKAGVADRADCKGCTPLHVAVAHGHCQPLQPELLKSSPGEGSSAKIRDVAPQGAAAPVFELQDLEPTSPVALPHCRVNCGTWYFELRSVHLQEASVGFADARAVLGGKSSSAGLHWAVQRSSSWPADATIGVALDADRCEVRICVNGAWEQIPSLQKFKFERFLVPIVCGRGQCQIHLRPSSAPRLGSALYRALHGVGALAPSSQRLVGALLAARADVGAMTSSGQTALHLAAQVGDAPAAQRLCDAGARVDTLAGEFACTALHLSLFDINAKSLALAMALVIAKADVNLPSPLDKKGALSPFLYAQRCQHPHRPLHDAVEGGPAALVELLLKARADSNAPIESRTVVKRQAWLPLPWPKDDEEPAEPGSQVDRGLRTGAQVALTVDFAMKVLPPLGVDAKRLEKAVSEAVSLGRAVLRGQVARIAGDSCYQLGGGDLAELLADRKWCTDQLLVPRAALRVLVEVESVEVAVLRPLHRAAERNDADALQALLLAKADPSFPDGRDGKLALHRAVEHRNLEAVRALVAARSPLDLEDATPKRVRPLFPAVQAALAGNGMAVLEELLKARAAMDVSCSADGFTALHLAAAARNVTVIDVLLEHRADATVQDLAGRTPLHKAVNAAAPSEPSFDVERKLLDGGAPVNAIDKRGRTALHYAFVKEGKPWDASFADPVETVTSLCAVEGVLVDVADEFGATPLLYAARRGATISSLYLAKRGISLQARDVHQNDVLGMALAGAHHEYAITLLSQNAGDVNAPMRHVEPAPRNNAGGGTDMQVDSTGVKVGPPVTLFYEAIKNKWLGLAYLLLDHGFPFHKAIQDSLSLGEFRLVLTLLSKINPAQNELVRGLDGEGRNLLHVLADFPGKLGPEAGAISTEFAQRGVLPHQIDGRGRLPLHAAVANGHLDLSRWLLTVCGKETCSTRSTDGQVPLHGACSKQWLKKHGEGLHLQFLGLLLPGNSKASSEAFLDSTVDPRSLPKHIEPPIRSVPMVNAVALGFANSAARLLDAHADCNTRDGLGETALGAALHGGQGQVEKLVELLLFNGADANLRDARGNTPLRGAVECAPHALKLIDELVSAGARITDDPGSDPSGGSLVLDALKYPSTVEHPVPQILAKLLELKAQPGQGADAKGRSPLIVCVDAKRLVVVDALLAAGAPPTCADTAGRCAVTAAVAARDSGIALSLLKARADPQSGRDAGGRPPLFGAVRWGEWEVVSGLLSARADANNAGVDEAGRAPLSIAVRANAGAVAMSLLGAAADPKALDKGGRNAVHHCIEPLKYGSFENAELLAALLKAPAGREAATAPDARGATPSHLAAAQGSGKLIGLLAREGLCAKPSRATSSRAPALLDEPSGAPPSVEADALAELERIEASATPLPVPVHSAYGMAGDNKVLEREGVEHDALLFKVDLKRNEMRFYHLQLVHEVNKDLYVLFTRWGEIGETGMYQRTPQSSLEDGLKEFGKIFREKTGNLWATKDTEFERKPNKYQLLRRRRRVARQDELLRPFETELQCSLPSSLRRTVRAICDPAMVNQALASLGIKTQSMPFGSLTRATLTEAKELLGAIRVANEELQAIRSAMGTGDPTEAAKKRNDARERVLELSSRYYELVPRKAGASEVARPLENQSDLAKEFEALTDLAEASVGVQLLLGASHRQAEEHPLDYCLRGLGVALEEVDPSSEEFATLLRYARSTCTSGEPPRAAEPGDFIQVTKPLAGEPQQRNRQRAAQNRRPHDTVTAIYRLARQGEQTRFEASGAGDLENRRLLWHGSRLSNMIGIMAQGLRVAPPEAPATGYMFGKGVYFADMFSKSRQYCRSSGTGEPAYMMLCDVALGEMYRCKEALYMDSAQTGTHSTWGQGMRTPDWANQIVEPGGAALPTPTLGDAGSRSDFRLNYNEFIVYDPAQIRMRYLIELNNFECHVEEAAGTERAAKRPKLSQ